MKRRFLVLLFLIVCLLLNACAGATPQPAATVATTAPQPTTPPAAATTTTTGAHPIQGIYRTENVTVIRSLDPPGAWGWVDWWSVFELCFNTLYKYDLKGIVQPELASDMPAMSADGTTYTIPLRKGVKFHNGREMKAADVKFSLERQLWPDVESWGKSYMDNLIGYQEVISGTTKELSGMKAVDDYTLEIKLQKPQAVFLALLTQTFNSVVPQAETLAAGKDWGTKTLIGTGPFKFVEWRVGEVAIFERNPDYFRAGLPYLQRIENYENVDPAVQMLKWEKGEAEFIHEIPPAELPRILADPKLKAQIRTANTVINGRLVMHLKTKPFDDIRVRQAIAMAVDKAGMAKKLAGMLVTLEGFYVPSMPQFDPNFKSKYQYDPAKAKQLLADAGFPDGIKGLQMFSTPDVKSMAELVQEDLRAIGVEAELIVGDTADYQVKIVDGEIPLQMFQWGGLADAYEFISAYTTCKSIDTGYNYGKYCNTQVDDLANQAEALPLLDPQRTALYRQIEDIVINQDVAWVGLYNLTQPSLGVDYIHGDFMHPVAAYPVLENAWSDKP